LKILIGSHVQIEFRTNKLFFEPFFFLQWWTWFAVKVLVTHSQAALQWLPIWVRFGELRSCLCLVMLQGGRWGVSPVCKDHDAASEVVFVCAQRWSFFVRGRAKEWWWSLLVAHISHLNGHVHCASVSFLNLSKH